MILQLSFYILQAYENSLEEYRSLLERKEDDTDRYKESREGRDIVVEQLQELAALHAIVLKEVPRRIELILEETKESQDLEDMGGTPEEVEEKGKEWLERVEALLAFAGKAEIQLAQQDVKLNEGMEIDMEYLKVRVRFCIVFSHYNYIEYALFFVVNPEL